MNKVLLLPHSFKKIGWCIFVPAALLGILMAFDGFNGFPGTLLPDSTQISGTIDIWSNNVAIIGVLLGAVFITCSRERIEDELIGRIRLNALLVSLYCSVGATIAATLLLYDFTYLNFMIFNLCLLPVLFLIIEQIMLLRFRKEAAHEE